jgi:hypothetical protein
MIFSNPIYLIAAIVILIIILLSFIFLIYCAIFAYRENAERESDDPEKKDFARLSPWLTPVNPILWLGRLILLAPWSIPFGIFLILFPLILIIFRPLPEDSAFKRFILKVGNSALKINTKVLSAFGLHTKPIRFFA